MKIRFPNHVYLIRGNHESPEMTELFGFQDECKKKLNISMWHAFLKVFALLPLGAIVGGKMFCIHGGLSPSLHSLSDISAIRRPVDIPDEGLVADILWSDPDAMVTEWGPNDRGSTISWGLQAVEKFLKSTGMTYIVRAHQMAMGGYDFPFTPNKSVVTIFTASHYAGECHNKAAYLSIDDKWAMEFHVLPTWQPHVRLDDHDTFEARRPATGRRRVTAKEMVMAQRRFRVPR
jgi:serine/threonine-protein phosphatase PP1 catalytic subunit